MMTHLIHAEHNSSFYEILYRNKTIVKIIQHLPGDDPRGREIQYDSLSLEQRESILIAIINHLSNA